jgi:glutathione S-transferase
VLRVLGRTSSINVRKVLWTLAECGFDYAHEPEWAGGRSAREPEFLALNPNGLVPVLRDDDRVLWESHAICRYLVGKAGRSDLLPADPYARAQVEMWMDWQQTELNTAWNGAFLALVRKAGPAADDPKAIARSASAWNERMLLLETHIAGSGGHAAGARFTLADIPLGLSIQRWLLTPIERPSTPALLDYRARLQARPAAQAVIDPAVP